MSTLLAIGVANALCAAVLAIPALLASRYARRPALAHALWLLVLIKLITPPIVRPALPWLPAEGAPAPAPREQARPALTHTGGDLSLASLLDEPDRSAQTHFSAPTKIEDLAKAAGPAAPALPAPAAPDRIEPVSAGPDSHPASTPDASTTDSHTVAEAAEAADDRPAGAGGPPGLVFFLGCVWLLGAAACLAHTLFYAIRFQRLLRHARPAPEYLQAQARELARRMGLSRCPGVWLLPGSLPPLVWSLGRARILFPLGLLERLDREERASLLAHELGHVVRLDHWVRWLELVVLSLYWWYPLAWWARRQMQDREEECCDAHAAAAIDARTYATAILTAVDFLAELRPALPAVVSPLAGVASLRQRLTLIMVGGTPRRLSAPTRLAVLALSAAVLPLLPILTPALPELASSAAESDVKKKPAAEPEKPVEDGREPTDFERSAIDLVGGPDEVYSVALSPDGRYAAAGSGHVSRPGEVELYDVRSRKLLWKMHEARGVMSVHFAPDSKHLAWSGWDGIARVADVTTRKQAYVLPYAGNNRLALSGDGRWLATAGENRSLRLFHAADGKLVHLFRGELPHFYCVGFSHDSRYLAAGGTRFQGAATHFALLFDVRTHRQVAKLDGHTNSVINVAFAPRDEVIATSSADNTVRIWDAKTYKLLHTLTGHNDRVKGLAFSSDGKTLATGSGDRTIRLWNYRTGEQLAELEGHPAAVGEIAFSPDGNLLVSGGAQHSLKLWDIKARKELATLRENPEPAEGSNPLVMAVSPDGKTVATGRENGEVALLDAVSGDVLRTIKASDDAITTLVYSRDGTRLASSGPDTLIKLWDPVSGKEVLTLRGHDSWVYALAFSSDGKTLASGDYNKTIRLWRLAGGPPVKLTGHKASVRTLAFSPDGTLLASGSSDKMVRLWDLKTSTCKEVIKGHEGIVRVVAFAPDGRTLATAGEDGFLYLLDPATAKERFKVKAHATEVLSMAYSPAGGLLVTGAGAAGGQLRFWDPATGKMRSERYAHGEGVQGIAFGRGGRQLFSLGVGRSLKRWQAVVSPLRYFEGHTGPVNSLAVAPDGKRVLSCGSWPQGDSTLRLWDLDTGKAVRTFAGNGTARLQCAAFSPDGKFAFAGGSDGRIWQWDADNGKLLHQITGHKDAVAGLSFSPDGMKMISASHDKTLRLWSVADGETERIFTGHTDWARRAVFLPDGKRLLSGGRDRMLRLWDVESGKLLKSIPHEGAWVESIALTRDGKRCLSGGGDLMYLWDLEKGKVLRAFAGHAFGVTCVALTRDDRQALSCSYDGSIRLWDIESGSEVQRFGPHNNWVWSVALTPDGKRFVTAGGGNQENGAYVPGTDFALRLWEMPRRSAGR
jgi:WD40 repeat protein/beta-lactamase regulating signal transducer with metallopeptidase domain